MQMKNTENAWKKSLELITIECSLTYQALVLEAVVDRSDKEPEGPVMQGIRTFVDLRRIWMNSFWWLWYHQLTKGTQIEIPASSR